MASTIAVGIRVFCVGLALAAAAVFGAAPRSPLLGLSRDQLLQQQGEPNSQLAAGNREVMIFDRERITLRNGVVIEVEPLAPDPALKRIAPPAPAPTEPAAPPGATADPNAAAPGMPGGGDVPEPEPNPQAPGAAAPTAAPAPPPEPQLSIKSIRPPGSPAPRVEPKAETPPPAPDTAKTDVIAPATPSIAPTPPASATKSAVAPKVSNDAEATSPSTAASIAPEPPSAAASDAPLADQQDEPAPAPAEKKKAPRSASEPRIPDVQESIFSGRTYLIAFIVIGAGIGFLIWQRQQRQLALAATAVSRTPFSPTPTAVGGAMFPATLLHELEWKRFEELVAAYYSKTGVVAERTKAGPSSPVHIRIAWKGEPRPFAYVQCIAHPRGLIDVAPIQELFTALNAEDIRRGYVVTTGKFNVPARDFAEEKHITLMSGDIFLEKINALPASARAELIQEFSVGDYKTPSCPKCDAKMVKSPEDPAVWQCKAHPDITIAAWK